MFWLCMENLGSRGTRCCWCSRMSQGEEGRALYQSLQLLHIFVRVPFHTFIHFFFHILHAHRKLHRIVVGSLSLEVLQNRRDVALRDVVWCCGGDGLGLCLVILEVFSNLEDSLSFFSYHYPKSFLRKGLCLCPVPANTCCMLGTKQEIRAVAESYWLG